MVENVLSTVKREETIVVSLAQCERDIEVIRGDTIFFKVRSIYSDDDYMNLTTCLLLMAVKEEQTDDDIDAVIKKEIGVGITVIEELNGFFSVRIDSVDTKDLEEGVYYYDIRYKHTVTGEVYTIMRGKFIIYAGTNHDLLPWGG